MKNAQPPRPAARRRPTALRLEPLEGRDVPSTFTVTTLADAGPGSLRAALAAATAHPGADTVRFAGGLHGTISLGSEIGITDDVTVDGPGANKLTVSGNDASRVFNIRSGTATISGLTV